MGRKKLGAPRRLSKTNIERVPSSTGIYVIKSGRGTTQYVGRSQNLKARLSQHYSKKSVPNASTFQTRTVRSTRKVKSLESEYIRRYKPKYNILKNKK